MNLFTFCNHSFQLSSPLDLGLFECWNETMPFISVFLDLAQMNGCWKSASQKDWRTFLCQCSSKSKAHFYQNQMSWVKNAPLGSALSVLLILRWGPESAFKKSIPSHLILISITQSWEHCPRKCWVLAEINTEASHAQISKGFLLKFPSLFHRPHPTFLFSSLST